MASLSESITTMVTTTTPQSQSLSTIPISTPTPTTSLEPELSSKPISPLLALPAELRNQIYTLLLTYPFPSTPPSTLRHRPPPSSLITPGLIRTCRQIYFEALPLFYGSNTFTAHASLLSSLPHLFSPSRPVICGPGLSKIRKWYITIRLDVDPTFSASQASAAFSGADELEVDVFQSMYGSCGVGVLRLFEGVRGVGKASVRCGGGAEAYARWLEGQMMMRAGEGGEGFGEVEEWEPWEKGNR